MLMLTMMVCRYIRLYDRGEPHHHRRGVYKNRRKLSYTQNN
jgi:hypothetical protein